MTDSSGSTPDKLDVPAQTVEVTTPGPVLPTQRTIEKAKISEGQRRVNIIWERTQQLIALSVVEVALIVAAFIVFRNVNCDPALSSDQCSSVSATAGVAFVFLASVANLVIGFYFGRTNHQKIGGPGGGDEVGGR